MCTVQCKDGPKSCGFSKKVFNFCLEFFKPFISTVQKTWRIIWYYANSLNLRMYVLAMHTMLVNILLAVWFLWPNDATTKWETLITSHVLPSYTCLYFRMNTMSQLRVYTAYITLPNMASGTYEQYCALLLRIICCSTGTVLCKLEAHE